MNIGLQNTFVPNRAWSHKTTETEGKFETAVPKR